MVLTQLDPEQLLNRKQLADALTERGFTISHATLATQATRGGGPPFVQWGRFPRYRWGTSLQWAQTRLGKPIASTSGITGRAGTACAVHRGAALEGEGGGTSEVKPTIDKETRK